MKRVMLIVNPESGRHGLRNYLQDIITIFHKAGWETTVFPTHRSGDATRYIEERYKDFDVTVCSGGDGTLHECMVGLMNQSLPMKLGYIPVGTSNDLALTMNISRNPLKAAREITMLNEIPHDIGCMNSQFFTYVAAFGTYSNISYITPQVLKRRMGKLAYILEAVKHIPDIKPKRAKFILDGKTIEGEFVVGIIMNSKSFGGMFKIKDSQFALDDGIFEVMLLQPPKSPVKVAHMVDQLIHKRYEKDDIMLFQAREITVITDPDTAWCLDGEFGGKHETVNIKAAERQIVFYGGCN